MSKGYGKSERVNASFSDVPATECIGAGRIEGWFATDAYTADKRGWGHVLSFCYEGELFFHLQRSPGMRGIQFYKKDPVTFEVVEMNGRCEAVKMMTPKMVEQEQARARGELVDEEAVKPDPKELVGQRVEGIVQGQYQLMLKQKWGFVTSDAFAGKVFWHITESPDMQEVEFERESYVEFDIVYDNARGGANDIRARNMKYMRPPANALSRGRQIATQRDRKKAEKRKAGNTKKGNAEGLSAAQRKERDAQRMREKQQQQAKNG